MIEPVLLHSFFTVNFHTDQNEIRHKRNQADPRRKISFNFHVKVYGKWRLGTLFAGFCFVKSSYAFVHLPCSGVQLNWHCCTRGWCCSLWTFDKQMNLLRASWLSSCCMSSVSDLTAGSCLMLLYSSCMSSSSCCT